MQTCPREAARAGKPRIGERIGVRVLSAPAAICSHCLQRAAARRAGALLPSASLHSKHMGGQNSVHVDCLRKLPRKRHAAGRREERAPRRAEQAAEGSTTFKFHVSQSDFHFRNYIFSAGAAVTKPHLFRYRSVSLRAAAAWVGRLGRRLALRTGFQDCRLPPNRPRRALGAALLCRTRFRTCSTPPALLPAAPTNSPTFLDTPG